MFRKNTRTALMLTSTIITATLILPIPLINANAAYTYHKIDGSYRMIDGTAINGVLARGVDVSHWKGAIDWNAVAADDIQFAMLGTRYQNNVDPYFRANATGAYEAGLNIGAYIYSYATTPQMASDEADFILNLVKDYPISYPIAFDAESNVLGALSPQQISEIINTFCKKIEDAGYYPMVYANDYWLANKIDMSMMPYDVWVARYENMPVFSTPAMWQVTQTGSVSGVNGNVDIDFQYKDYSSLIPANRWRTIGGKTYYYQDFLMQKNTWIQDDTASYFYIGDDAQAMKGWQKLNGHYYYLNEQDGRMASNWLEQNNNWYYLGSSGAMKTGRITVDGANYLMNDDGIMHTGWYTDKDSDYYFSSSGKMATGWKQIDSTWYYFNENGQKHTGWLNDNNQNHYLDTNGKMLTGWQKIDNSWYFFNPSGQRQSGWMTDDNQTYYLNSDGKMATGWQNLDGSWYFFNSSGYRQAGWLNDGNQTYYLNSGGKMLTGWQQLDNSWYRFNSSGQRQSGMVTLDGVNYYLDSTSGVMAAGTTMTIDGIQYQIDDNGVCTPVVHEDGTAAEAETPPPPTAPKGPGEM